MRWPAVLLILLPSIAFAQSVMQQTDSMVATSGTIMASMRGQIASDQATIADLQKQLEAAKKCQQTPTQTPQ